MDITAKCSECNRDLYASIAEFKEWLDNAIEFSNSKNQGRNITIMCPFCAQKQLNQIRKYNAEMQRNADPTV